MEARLRQLQRPGARAVGALAHRMQHLRVSRWPPSVDRPQAQGFRVRVIGGTQLNPKPFGRWCGLTALADRMQQMRAVRWPPRPGGFARRGLAVELLHYTGMPARPMSASYAMTHAPACSVGASTYGSVGQLLQSTAGYL